MIDFCYFVIPEWPVTLPDCGMLDDLWAQLNLLMAAIPSEACFTREHLPTHRLDF